MTITQENCSTGRRWWLLAAFVAAMVFAAPALGQSRITPADSGSDPILTGSAGPCHPDLASPDYVAGTDATGNPVAPADVAGSTVALGSDNVIARQDDDGHLHGRVVVGTGGVYVGVHVNGLRDKVNPPPACGPNRRH